MAAEKKRIDTDVVVVGGGTAGLTAAIYVCRAGRSVYVLEAQAFGGQIVNTPEIENYPGLAHTNGYDYSEKLRAQAEELGAGLKMEKVSAVRDEEGFHVVETRRHAYYAKAVIIATGAKNRPLGLAREEELTGRGISYCATCDGAFFRGKVTAVNGGGNTAIEDAAYLAKLCEKVYLIHRREGFRAEPAALEALRAMSNVEFVVNSTVTALRGEDRLSEIEVANKVTGERRSIAVDGLFVAIGQMPDNQVFASWADLDGAGYVAAGEDCRTRTPGVYVAGDCRTKTVRQLTTAAADGAVAALAAVEHCNRQ